MPSNQYLAIAVANANKIYLFDPSTLDLAEFDPPLGSPTTNAGAHALWGDDFGRLICTPRKASDNQRHCYHLEDGAWVDKGVSPLGNMWSISGYDYQNVWCVNGDSYDVGFWDGDTWIVDATNIASARLDQISCCGPGDDEVFAVSSGFHVRTGGARGSGVWVNKTSQLWTDTGLSSSQCALRNVYAVSKTEVYIAITRLVVGDPALAYVVLWNGSAFSIVATSAYYHNGVGAFTENGAGGFGSEMSMVSSDPSYGNYHVWTYSGSSLLRLTPEPNMLNAATILGSAGRFCVGSSANLLRVWDFASGTPTQVASLSIGFSSGLTGLTWWKEVIPFTVTPEPECGFGARVGHRGGSIVTLSGVPVSTTKEYEFFMGLAGDETDAPCYSGVPGQGYVVKSEDGETFNIVTPPAAIGENIISFREVGGSIDDSTGTIDVVSEPHRDKAHRLRSSLQPWQSTGQRRIGDW
jgi:hypothetical protein